MIYDAYQTYADVSRPIRGLASHSARVLGLSRDLAPTFLGRPVSAFCEMVSLSGFTHVRPAYDIEEMDLGDGHIARVSESVAMKTPFCDLLLFSREGGADLPQILLVAPMSGHFATLLRGTIQTLLRDFRVFITDWKNARDIPLDAGEFGFDDFVDHIIKFMQFIGPRNSVAK